MWPTRGVSVWPQPEAYAMQYNVHTEPGQLVNYTVDSYEHVVFGNK